MLYKIKYGSHCDGKNLYPEGSLIESDQDLVKLDRIKFVEVSRRPPEEQKSPPRVSEELALGDLTTDELRMLAEAERIDVSGLDRELVLNILKSVLGEDS